MARNKAARATRPPLKIVVVGHAGHGKSSLIGRLLYDTGSLPPGEEKELTTVSARRGAEMEWSVALDTLRDERDQPAAGDTTQIRLKTAQRDTVIVGAPGDRKFLGDMVCGAARADAAILVVDAVEGLRQESRRHANLLDLLGIRQMVVAVSKMDSVAFGEGRFAEVSREIMQSLGEIGITPAFTVPVSASAGDNVAGPSGATPWYSGPSVLEALDRLHGGTQPVDQPLRLPIQDVDKLDQRWILAGRIESGVLHVGDTLLFSPSNETARVNSIEAGNTDRPPVSARAGESVGITLDEQIFVERGEVASHEEMPPQLTTVFRMILAWSGRGPLERDKSYKLRLATQEARVAVQSIERIIDTDSLEERAGDRAGDQVERDTVADVVLRGRRILALDEYRSVAPTGLGVLLDGNETVARGVISMEGYPDQRQALTVKSTNLTGVEHRVTAEQRLQRNHHGGGVLWFTGLSGAGKSTLAMAVEQVLFKKGFHVYVLDGDNVRRGLNVNLGFSPEDRTENIRRVGEVAALFAESGMICISAFISPYEDDRDRARAAAGAAFHEVFINADLATCEERDPKGLYRRARAGEIQDFTGVSAPYEPPATPELAVDTAVNSINECVREIVDYVERTFTLDSGPG